MSSPEPAYECARCGRSVGNGSVQQCAVVSDLQESEQDDVAAVPVIYRFCREPQKGAPNGCAARVLGPAALAAHLKGRTP